MPAPASPDPDALLSTSPPPATLDDAVGIARDAYGLAVEAAPLTSERDRNFHLSTADGRGFVLKIANAAEDPAVSDLQIGALRHIAARDPALPVPRVCPTTDGRFGFAMPLGGRAHIVRLLTYLPGEPLHLSRPSPEQAAALGRCLAATGLALADFRHPASGHDLLWDLQRAPKLRALIPLIPDARRRALAGAALDHYVEDVEPQAVGFRAQVVHNDFNPHNVLVDPADPTRVTGIVDFGDVVHTALVNDVAVAAAYQVEGADPLDRPTVLVAAYHAVCPLHPAEVDTLFDLVTLRHVLSVTITEWRAALYPDNAAYILRNQPRAAAALESLDRVGRARGRALFRRACGLE